MRTNSVVMPLFVDDYDDAIRFFVEDLGLFEIVANVGKPPDQIYVNLALKEHVRLFSLHLLKAKIPAQCRGSQSSPLLTLPITDADELHARLRQQGVHVDATVDEYPWGAGFDVVDPFGNHISLFEHFRNSE